MDFSKLAFRALQIDNYIESDYEHDFTQLPRPQSSIAYMEYGKAEFFTAGQTIRINSGDLIFVPSGSCYRSRWYGEPKSSVISCHFDFAVKSSSGSGSFIVQKISGLEELYGDFRFLLDNFDSLSATDSGRIAILARFYGICSRFMPLLERHDSLTMQPVQRAVDYIDRCFDKKTEVAKLAKLCDLSESYFFDRFKHAVGVSPIEYKNRVAISHAEQLLSDEPSLAIEELSERLGFESSAYFRRVFRRLTGLSPREYRKNGRCGL